MKTRLCVSTYGNDVEELSYRIAEALDAGAELVEARLDYLKLIEPEKLARMLKPYADKLIITLRPKNQGGLYVGDEAHRISLLTKLCRISPAYVDVELDAATPGLIDSIRREDVKIIISWHDYARTPKQDFLRNLCEKALTIGDVAKIVTLSSCEEDNLRVVKLYAYYPHERLVAFCMGDSGRVTRLLAVCAGAPIMYVALGGRTTAKGQIELEEMRRIREWAWTKKE